MTSLFYIYRWVEDVESYKVKLEAAEAELSQLRTEMGENMRVMREDLSAERAKARQAAR